MFESDELERIVVLLDSHDFQVHMHAIGDRAVRDSLDAIEAAARANGRRDARHHLAHLQLVHPDDVPRFAELGVVPNVSPLWACHSGYVDELTEPFIGPERSARMYPFGSLHRAGAPPGVRERLDGLDGRPAPPARGGRDSDLAGDARPGAAAPGGGARPAHRPPNVHGRLGARELPRRRRRARSSRGSSPTSSSSTGTSWTPGPARSATLASSSPWSRAKRSTPIPGSAGRSQRPRSSSFRPRASCSLRSQSAKKGSTIR